MKTPLKDLSKRLLLKHTATVHSSSKLTMVQKKIFNLLIYKAFPSIQEDKYHTFRVIDLMQSLGWSFGSNINNRLKEALIGLTRENVRWNILEKDKKRKWVASACLADVAIKDGIIEYSFGKFLREVLYNPNIYAKIDLDIQSTLESKDSLVIWELATEELSSKKTHSVRSPWIDWEKICNITSGERSSYQKNYALYKSKVLNKAILEINQKTDLSLKLIEKREGRKIKWIAFDIERENTFILPDFSQNENLEQESQIKKSVELIIGNSAKTNELCEKFTEDELQRGVEYYRYVLATRANEIKNPLAFFVKTLEESWHTPEEALSRIDKLKTTLSSPLTITTNEDSQEFLKIRESILSAYGDVVYLAWFKGAKFSLSESALHISHPNPYAHTQITQKYMSKLLELVQEYYPNVQKILVNEMIGV